METCKKCGCYTIGDYPDGFKVFDADDNFLGYISSDDYDGDAEALDNGECPICEQWEDGAGNTCNINGWTEA